MFYKRGLANRREKQKQKAKKKKGREHDQKGKQKKAKCVFMGESIESFEGKREIWFLLWRRKLVRIVISLGNPCPFLFLCMLHFAIFIFIRLYIKFYYFSLNEIFLFLIIMLSVSLA